MSVRIHPRNKCACGRPKLVPSRTCKSCQCRIVFRHRHVRTRRPKNLCRTCWREREPNRRHKTRCFSCAKKDAEYAKRQRTLRDTVAYFAQRDAVRFRIHGPASPREPLIVHVPTALSLVIAQVEQEREANRKAIKG
jgi:hypothetical protein